MSYETEHPYQTYDPNWNPDEVMTRLHQLQGRIASTMTEVERKDGEITEKMSTIEQTVDNIMAEVYLTNQDGTYTSRIDMNAFEISQRVMQIDYNGNMIASLINQTASEITILAEAIQFDGITNVNEVLTIGNGSGGTARLIFNGTDTEIYATGDGLSFDSLGFIQFLSHVTFNSMVDFGFATVQNLTANNSQKLNNYYDTDFVKTIQGVSLTLNSAGTLQLTTSSGKTATYAPTTWSG